MARSSFLILAMLSCGTACASRDASPPRAATEASTPAPPAVPQAPPTTVAAVDAFQTEVHPILARRCTPCHVPGGKMYERMPFDDADTVREHRDGILRRLDGEDKATVERWLLGR
jgi:hypothetical protein